MLTPNILESTFGIQLKFGLFCYMLASINPAPIHVYSGSQYKSAPIVIVAVLAMGEQSAWTCQLQMVIKGGFLKKGWAVPVTVVDDVPCMTLEKSHRELARAFGLDVTVRSPFQGVTVFDYIKCARDSKVDDLLREHLKTEDPMAETTSSQQVIASEGRTKLFIDAKVPATIVVTLEAFTCGDGVEVPPFEMTVVATSKRLGAPQVQVCPEVLEWLSKAHKHDWSAHIKSEERATPKKRQASELCDLPELQKPLKYQKTGKLAIYFNYRGQTGRWSRVQKKIDDLIGSCPQHNRSVIDNISENLMALYSKYHHGEHGDLCDDDQAIDEGDKTYESKTE
jgi:hypothetical protein